MLTACPAPCINSSNAGVVPPASPAAKTSGYAATTVVRGLAAAGLGGRSGLALGIGLDRLLLVKRIPDIRLLRSGDPRLPAATILRVALNHIADASNEGSPSVT